MNFDLSLLRVSRDWTADAWDGIGLVGYTNMMQVYSVATGICSCKLTREIQNELSAKAPRLS